jgi:hypothetical protein
MPLRYVTRDEAAEALSQLTDISMGVDRALEERFRELLGHEAEEARRAFADPVRRRVVYDAEAGEVSVLLDDAVFVSITAGDYRELEERSRAPA